MPVNSRSVGAVSTIRPAYMTLMRLGTPGDHAHVVGDQQRGHAQPVLEVVEQGQDLGLDRDVERGGRLVGDQHPRLAGQRDRDHHPLAQPAGELVRVILQPLARSRQPDQLEHLQRRGPAPPSSMPRGAGAPARPPARRSSWSGSARTASPGRSSRPRSRGACGSSPSGSPTSSWPLELDRAADDVTAVRQQPEDREAEHRLAAPGLADQPERLAGADLQVDVADRLHDRAARAGCGW